MFGKRPGLDATVVALTTEVVSAHYAAVLAAVAVLIGVLLRRGPGGLVPALALAPAATVLVSAAIWLRYLPAWPSVAAAAEIYLLSPLSMLAAPLLLAALLAVLTEFRRGRPVP
jgi:hypothetical protein